MSGRALNDASAEAGSRTRRTLPGVTDHPVFHRFERWSGVVPAGWHANFLGVLARDEYTAGMGGSVSAEDRHVTTALPAVDEEYIEWIDVLEAVASVPAGDTLTMIELGAGYGRWLACAVAAFRAIGGRSIRLVGVEVKPTHFRWMRDHLRANGIADAEVTLIEAAVAGRAGHVRFDVGYPSAWYGQAIDPNQPRSDGRPHLRLRTAHASSAEHVEDDRRRARRDPRVAHRAARPRRPPRHGHSGRRSRGARVATLSALRARCGWST